MGLIIYFVMINTGALFCIFADLGVVLSYFIGSTLTVLYFLLRGKGEEMKNNEAYDNAMILIREVNEALSHGTKHYRKSDGKLLTKPIEVIETLLREGEILLERE